MIVLPRRSVTRFFIPMIDVLILLFCAFLLMPFSNRTDAGTASAGDGRRKRLAEATERRQVEDRQRLEESIRQLRDARQATASGLSGRIAPILLAIDSKTGHLERREQAGTKIIDGDARPGQVRAMVDADRARLRDSTGRALEPYYTIQLPQDPLSPWPTREMRQKYLGWFQDAGAAADIGPPVEGARP